jgi:glycosyltransferase involved in cell wall biosynthesis
VFCFVGRIVKDKGINKLLSAFDRLSKENKDVKLLLVGPEERELDPISKQSQEIIKNNKQVISVGFQKDVRPFLAQSDVFVFPSYREGFPNVVMQAGAMELPSIVTNINGSNEIIEEGVNGTIIPVKDENALFDKMKLLAEDENLRNNLAKNARQMIVDRYEQKFVWNELLDEYNRLLSEKL